MYRDYVKMWSVIKMVIIYLKAKCYSLIKSDNHLNELRLDLCCKVARHIACINFRECFQNYLNFLLLTKYFWVIISEFLSLFLYIIMGFIFHYVCYVIFIGCYTN